MAILGSLVAFVWGVAKRIYLIAPSLLLDPFDLAKELGVAKYDPDPTLAWVLLAAGLAVAVLWTYHDARMQSLSPIERSRRLLRRELSFGLKRTTFRSILLEVGDELSNGVERRSLVALIQNRIGKGDMPAEKANEIIQSLRRANLLETDHRPAIYDAAGRYQLESAKDIERLNATGNNLLEEIR